MANILRFLFPPKNSARSDNTRDAVKAAAERNRKTVEELKRVLTEGPQLKLIVEPSRRSNGQYRSQLK